VLGGDGGGNVPLPGGTHAERSGPAAPNGVQDFLGRGFQCGGTQHHHGWASRRRLGLGMGYHPHLDTLARQVVRQCA